MNYETVEKDELETKKRLIVFSEAIKRKLQQEAKNQTYNNEEE